MSEDTQKYASQVCPGCGAFWHMKGDLDPGTGTWAVIPDSGPVDGAAPEIECPSCKVVFVPGPAPSTETGVPRARWVPKE